MGLPARIQEHHGIGPSRPRLKVVRAPKESPRHAASVQRCREVFTLACVVFIALTAFGLGRVMLSARAAEASLESSALQKDIKAERLAGDLLEVDKSALTTPSRIESIAGATMNMAEAQKVSYMEMPAAAADQASETGDPTESQESPAEAADSGGGFSAVVSSVMEMAAGEAQVMLVGDVGLASSE